MNVDKLLKEIRYVTDNNIKLPNEIISEDDIESLSNYSLDEQIVETIRVLLNNNINVNIFKNFACEIIDRKYTNSIDDEEKIVSIEIFDLFRTYGMRIDDL